MPTAFSSAHTLPLATLPEFTQSTVALSHLSDYRGTNRRHERNLPLYPRIALLCLAHVQTVEADQEGKSLCLAPTLSLSLSLSLWPMLRLNRAISHSHRWQVVLSYPSDSRGTKQTVCALSAALSTPASSPPCPWSGGRCRPDGTNT